MSEAVDALLAGLNGWFRWKNCAAHFYVNGKHVCSTHHTWRDGRGVELTRPAPAELSRHGVPYGRVCSKCMRRK